MAFSEESPKHTHDHSPSHFLPISQFLPVTTFCVPFSRLLSYIVIIKEKHVCAPHNPQCFKKLFQLKIGEIIQ